MSLMTYFDFQSITQSNLIGYNICHFHGKNSLSVIIFFANVFFGIDSIKKGRTHSTNDVGKMLADEFGI